jgi:hypothetical protein
MTNTTIPTTSNVPAKQKDDDVGIMIYGNVKIRDIDSGKILVNQRA